MSAIDWDQVEADQDAAYVADGRIQGYPLLVCDWRMNIRRLRDNNADRDEVLVLLTRPLARPEECRPGTLTRELFLALFQEEWPA
jgi:hypothetical protein